MNTIEISIINDYFPSLIEKFVTQADISNTEDIETIVEECYEIYLDMHHDIIVAKAPDVDFDTLIEAFSYIVEDGIKYDA